MPNARILVGDAKEVLRGLGAGIARCCVTSPPESYWGLRDYGVELRIWGGEDHEHKWADSIKNNATNHTDKRRWQHTRNGRDEEQPMEKRVAWLRTEVNQGNFCACGAWRGALGLEPTPELYVEHVVAMFREVRRVLAGDGTLWLNLGDCYATGAGKVGDHPGGGEQGERWKGNRGTHDANNSGKHGPSLAEMGPRTQPNRMPIQGLKPKDLVGIPWRVAFALQADGWWLRSDIIWAKPNPMPESVTDRPTKAHEYLFLLAKSERYYYDATAIAEAVMNGDHPRDETPPPSLVPGASNHNGLRSWWKKSGNKERKLAAGGNGKRPADHRGSSIPWGGITRNRRSVWTIATAPFPEAHFATFPPALVEPCILAGSAIGDTVLDPFTGAGTTGLVASRLNRGFVGIELNPKYAEMARRRIEQDAPLLNEVEVTA